MIGKSSHNLKTIETEIYLAFGIVRLHLRNEISALTILFPPF